MNRTVGVAERAVLGELLHERRPGWARPVSASTLARYSSLRFEGALLGHVTQVQH